MCVCVFTIVCTYTSNSWLATQKSSKHFLPKIIPYRIAQPWRRRVQTDIFFDLKGTHTHQSTGTTTHSCEWAAKGGIPTSQSKCTQCVHTHTHRVIVYDLVSLTPSGVAPHTPLHFSLAFPQYMCKDERKHVLK